MSTVNQARFTIDATPSEDPVTGDPGYIAAFNQTLDFTLETSPSSALSVTYSVFDAADTSSPLSSYGATALTFVGSGTASETLVNPNGTAQIIMPAFGVASYIVRCSVCMSDATHIYERLVVLEAGTTPALRKTVPAETDQYYKRGWSDEQNKMVEAILGATGLYWGSAGTYQNTWVTDIGGGSIAVLGGTGYLRTTPSVVGVITAVTWAAVAGVAIPANTTRYVGVEYNGGAPQVIVRVANTFNGFDDFLLATVYNEAGTVHILEHEQATMDGVHGSYARFFGNFPLSRAERTGGLIVGDTGVRNLTMSAGVLYDGLSSLTIAAFDSSGASLFDYYFRDGAGGWTKEAAKSQYTSSRYDDGTGVLNALTAAHYGITWWYLESDSHVVGLYGWGNYATLAEAEDATPPSSVPERITAHGLLIGRTIVLRGAASATEVESVFSVEFGLTAVTSHNSLAGLQGGVAGEYYHLTSAQHTDLTDGLTCTSHVHTLDQTYRAAVATVTADVHDVTWNLTGAYSFVLGLAGCTGAADGFQITNGTDFLSVLRADVDNMAWTSEFETFDLNVERDIHIDSLMSVGITTGATGFTVNTTQLVMDQTTGYLGLGVAVPSGMIAMNGEANRQMGMERRTAADTAGKNLAFAAGGATIGATDKNGGDLNLASGISTGTGSSGFNLYCYPAGAAGIVDNTPIAMIQGTAALLTLGDTTGATATTVRAGTGALLLSGAGFINFVDAYKAAGGYAGDFHLSLNAGEWTSFETNFGEVSLLNAINQCAALAVVTLDEAYDAGGAGVGRAITADSGAVDISVPVLVNGTALALHQLMPAATADVFTIENLGTSGASIALTGTRRFIETDSADATFALVAADANNYYLHLSASNGGAGTAGIGIGADDNIDIISSAGCLTLHGYSSAGVGVEIEATAGGGTVNICAVNLPNALNIGTAGARDIDIGSSAATSITAEAKDVSLGVVDNDAAAHTFAISATNAGAGTALLNIDADDAITIDSLAAGISLDGVTASNFSVTGANLTLSTITSGVLALTSAGLLTLTDGFKAASTYGTDLVLSDASAEWDTFDTNFGEVSLLNAINQCASTAVTLDEAYNAGAATITVDAYDTTWNLTGAFSHVINAAGCTGVADGAFVEDGTDYWRLTHAGADTLNLSAELGSATIGTSLTFDLNAVGAITLDSSGGTIGIGVNADAFGINIGTGAAARVITIGNLTTTTAVNFNTGTGGSLMTLANDAQFTVQGSATATVSPYAAMLLRNPQDSGSGTDYDNEVHLRLWAGTTTSHRAYINFTDNTGTDKWMTGRNASSVWILYNSETCHRLWFENDDTAPFNSGNSYINAGGTGIVRFGYHASDSVGTGGAEVWSGGVAPSLWHQFNGTNAILGRKTGIGCTPTQMLDIQSGAIRFGYVVKPIAPVASLSGAGSVNTAGTHVVAVTYGTALNVGETELSVVSNVVTVTAAQEYIDITLPVSADQNVTYRNVYMSKQGTVTPLYRVAASPVVNNNTGITYQISVADASLVTAGSATVNTTSGRIHCGSISCFAVDSLGNLVLGGNGGTVYASGATLILAGSVGVTAFKSNTGAAYFGVMNQYGIGSLGCSPASGENFAMLGTSAAGVKMQRHTTANTAGNSLSLIAGGATLLATDKNGGELLLKPGQATGTGFALSSMWCTPVGAAGTTTNDPVRVLTCAPLTGGAAGSFGVGVGTSTPTSPFDLERAGTAKSVVDFLEITNTVNAADMDGTGTGIVWNQWYYDAATPAVADAGRIACITENDWTSVNQDSCLAFYNAGTRAVEEKMRLNSKGTLQLMGTVTNANAYGALHLFYTGTVPIAATADSILAYAVDSSDNTATLGLMLEQAVEAIGAGFTPDFKLKILVDGVEYRIALEAV
jgi:hypothetical protein